MYLFLDYLHSLRVLDNSLWKTLFLSAFHTLCFFLCLLASKAQRIQRSLSLSQF